jgi:hypothetical protein
MNGKKGVKRTLISELHLHYCRSQAKSSRELEIFAIFLGLDRDSVF